MSPGARAQLVGDPTRIRQVISNLVGNAIKFTDKGQVEVHISDRLLPDGQIEIYTRVIDTGPGLSAEGKEKLFQKFTQADSSITRKFGGAGLGLSICKQLVELMGGQIGVSGELGHGSTFWFRLPLRPSAHQQKTAPDDHSALRGRRILIVDDLEMNRRIFRKQLESVGAEVHDVDDGGKALELLQRAARTPQPFEVLITDHQMPGMTGKELIAQIALVPSLQKLPIILASSIGSADRSLRDAADAVINKPARQQLLFRTIASFFGGPGVTDLTDAMPSTITIDASGLRALLADDNETIRTLATILLTRVGFSVDTAGDGQQAADKAAGHDYDLILLDIQMPNVDGHEAARRIRALKGVRAQTPIVALTANAFPGARESYIAAGMNDYVSKPIHAPRFYSTLATLLPKVKLVSTPSIPISLETSSTPLEPRSRTTVHLDARTVDGLQQLMTGEKFTKFINVFLREVSERVKAFPQRLIEKSYGELARDAHAIKGNAGSVGALELASLAKDLEIACKNNRETEIPELIERITAEMKVVAAQIQELISKAS